MTAPKPVPPEKVAALILSTPLHWKPSRNEDEQDALLKVFVQLAPKAEPNRGAPRP